MAIPDGAILRLVASILLPESVIAQNVFYAVFADTGGSNDDLDVLSDLGDYIGDVWDKIKGSISVDVTMTGIKVYIYDPLDPDWDEVGDELIGIAGVSGTDMLTHGVAALIHAKTTDPDVQAAKFIPGMGEANTVDGLFIAAALTAMTNYADEWTTPFVGAATGGDFAPGVWSVANTLFYMFNGTEVVNAIPGYQRRRKPGVGI